MIRRAFGKVSKEIIISLYSTYVRPNLEYCIQAWAPHCQKDIDTFRKGTEKGYQDFQYSVVMREGSLIKSLYEPSTMHKFIDSIFKTVNWVKGSLIKSLYEPSTMHKFIDSMFKTINWVTCDNNLI